MKALWLASYHSRHFVFEGTGTSRAQALDVCKQGMRAHGKQYGISETWWSEDSVGDGDDDISIRELVVGTAYRDGSEI